ncbi:MAG TPA: hypothetical protein VLG47_02335 [Candidatus Saccharimonadales bacterium]|nr:hypothetical protein [Candidatus Saccharimonadales bacterium]
MIRSRNETQARIVQRLLERDGQRFSEINIDGIPTDVFSYHLRQLIKAGQIEKLPDQTYRLTPHAKRHTDALYPEGPTFVSHGSISTLLFAARQGEGQEEYLTQTRTKVPSLGKVGLIALKVRFGENPVSSAKRSLDMQAGLSGKLDLGSIWHSVDRIDGEIVDDRYFFIFKISEIEGELKKSGITGENKWMTLQEMKDTGKMFPEVDKFIDSMKSDQITYHERFTEGESL